MTIDYILILRVVTGILFGLAVPPAILLLSIFYGESKHISERFRLINTILFTSALVGSLALVMSISITAVFIFNKNIDHVSYVIANILIGLFFNIHSWGLLYVRKRSLRESSEKRSK